MGNECMPFKEPGARVTGYAASAVTGKRFVSITADIRPDGMLSVGHAAGRGIGVAAYDAATGQRVGIIRGARTVVPVLAAVSAAAGTEVASDGQGRVVVATGAASGYLEAASIPGQDARVCLY